MTLTTEEDGDIAGVMAADLDRVLPADGFCKFAVLSKSAGAFIQAGNGWQPGQECRAFLRDHGSDPWVLEYREGRRGRQFRATGWVTLEQVRRAFQSYLAGGAEWREMFAWREVDA